jgi:hypothetical protein
MMTWNYRVFREANGDHIIREVFYAEDSSVVGCTENAVEPFGESLDELAKDIEWFKEALELPVLTLADIPRPSRKGQKRNRSKNVSRKQLVAELTKPPKSERSRRSANKCVLVASGRGK